MDNNKSAVKSIVKTSNDITSSFAKLKFVTIACFVVMVVVSLGSVFINMTKMAEVNNKIYVVDRGQSISATRTDASYARSDEAKFFSKYFHMLLFNITGNREVLEHNLNEALTFSSDRSVYDFYARLEERGFYRGLQTQNAFQEIQIDSVKTNMSVYPYQVVTYSTVWKARSSVMSKNAMVTTMRLIDVERNINNTNGFKIEKFEVVSDNELERRKR